MYDLIGDIHGHADELEKWLKNHGYIASQRGYRHPERTLIFLGDLIDRGPKIRRVVEIARAMVDSGAARIVMGNHEFNALCYHTLDPNETGTYLRKHTTQNTKQHHKTLEAFPDIGELRDLLDWFYTIPLWMDFPELRAVHACWHKESLERLKATLPNGRLSPETLARCARKDGDLYEAIENVLKGPEIELPAGYSFEDKDGIERHHVRAKWCVAPQGETYRSYSFPEQAAAPDFPLGEIGLSGYPDDEKPVFFGHYWLRAESPQAISKNCFCLDYSVAKGGFLCGYRWGEGFLV